MDEIPQFFGTPGDAVPTVDAADMTAVWNLWEDIRAHSPRSAGVGLALIKSVCSPTANLGALSYRMLMLQLLAMMGRGELAGLRDNEPFRSTVFKVAARMPLTWIELKGPVSKDLPFDVDAFLEEVRKASEQ